MIINKNQTLTLKDILKVIINGIIAIIVVSILLSILFKDHFRELKKLRDAENVMIMNHTREILEDTYNVPIDIKSLKRNRYSVLAGGPKKIYGNYIYDIYISESFDKYLIYWELTEDTPEIKRIEKYNSKEIIYEVSTGNRNNAEVTDTKFKEKTQTQ